MRDINDTYAEKSDKVNDNNKENEGGFKEKANEYIEDLKEKTDKYSEQARIYWDDLSDYIKKCPIKSVAIATIAGMTIATLLKK